MTDLPTVGMEDWDSLMDSTVGCHKKLRSTLTPLLEELSSCSTLKKCTVKMDPLTRKFQGMALTQLATSETHQAE
jgi:hypothetical protein